MLKRFFLTLALSARLLSPAHSAGTIPGFSLQQQFDNLGRPLANCQFYTIIAGTTSTPQNAFQDTALTLALPNPQTCDASGRLPQMFVADGLIKVRLTDRSGVTQVVADNVLVIGPSGGGGGGGTVDPTTILTTGDFKLAYSTSVLTGFVRANGRTIGSATSGATERANADTQALFVYLWGNDPNLAVSTGRGASAAADWAANKTIALPDFSGKAVAGMDDMGAGARGVLTATYCGTSPTVLGASCGAQSSTLATLNLPPYTPAGSVPASGLQYGKPNTPVGVTTSGGVGASVWQADPSFLASNVTGTATLVGTAQGGTSTPFSLMQPTKLLTIYQKL